MTFFQRYNPEGLSQRLQTGGPVNETQLRKRVFTEGLSVKDVAKHNSREDCWLIIEEKAYDVTTWIEKHPGGDILLSYAGLDATDVFEAFHDENSYKLLKGFYIGDVKDVVVSPALAEHRKLKEKFVKENFYESNKLFYAYKFMTNITLLTLSVLIAANFESTLRILVAGFFLGLFWQQCGWLSHDFLHHQVFKNRKYNNFMGYLIGNVFQGFSVSWWKAKHNLHHAVPNVAGFDPDIDTLPFLAWSEKLIENELTGLPQILIKYQYIFYFPLLSAARMSWLIQSWLYADKKANANVRNVELFCLMLHYTWYFAIMFSFMSIKESLLYILVSQATTGLLLSSAFSLNHNGMKIWESGSQATLDFNTLQVTTGRDVSGLFTHWFMGGLDKQIEHHLYPRIPRHNLIEVQKFVEPICVKHNISYHKTGFLDGTKELLSRLYTVSEAVKN